MRKNLEALAYEEAQRLLETCFTFHNPYTCIIDNEGIPFEKHEDFYRMVEEELLAKGEKIERRGAFFKILKFQKNKKAWPQTTQLGGFVYSKQVDVTTKIC